MRKVLTMLALAVLPATGGCVAKAAWDVATLPVKAGAAVVDSVTTSPKERDEKWVRQQRKADEREAKERREWDKKCRKDPEACGPYDGFRARDDWRREG
jgi:hypothetical protein